MKKRYFLIASLAVVFLTVSTGFAASSGKYPSDPVVIRVGHRAGGSTDIITRSLQPYFQKALGGTVVVENIEGGGGNVALTQLYKATPDGYTLGMFPFPSATLGELVKNGRFKVKEFTYLYGVTGGDYNAIFVKYDSPYQDLKSLVNDSKSKKITLSGSGVGTNSHMAMKLLEKASGAKFEYVSFDSGTEAAIAVAGSHTVTGIGNMVSLKQLADDKKIRILACFGEKRHPNFSDVPTAMEAGFKKTAMDVMVGMIAPPKLPADIHKALSDALAKAVNDPGFKKVAQSQGSNVSPLGPAEFKKQAFEIYDDADAIKGELKSNL
jgi:tripartite-type tricarboxylate transporter receptor subunit TctC